MLNSLLVTLILFGLISMILPYDRKGEWISFLLLATVFASMIVGVSRSEIDLPQPDLPTVNEEICPERTVLHWQISSRVTEITGTAPLRVDTDFQRDGDSLIFTRIYVELSVGAQEEVANDLRSVFGIESVTVIGPSSNGVTKDHGLFSPQ